ncbi:MAG: YebC/PmpR family DNA-binding transcriptional regulator [Actinobacteria bacterium]|nr:YebC/PmpR family DNA-binding transcriptional regulator [Actinomycetota bacterium]
MSGHSKWSTIKRKKGAADAKRGKLFARMARAIQVAAREGHADPDFNPTLADAIQRAKDNDVPKDTIERALKRGAGDMEGVNYETVQYEGYGPSGVAILVDCLTDNRNRTAADVRSIFTKNGGNLAEPGSVSYLFSRRGQVILPADGANEDDVLTAGLDAGLEDVEIDDDRIVAWCDPSDVQDLRSALEDGGLSVKESGSTMVPSTAVPVTERDEARRLLRLLDAIEDNDDVQEVFSNEDIPDDLMQELATE